MFHKYSREKNQFSFNFYSQTLADIAAHSVTQTISWPVLGNIVTISKNLGRFFHNVSIDYLLGNVRIKKTWFLFSYSISHLLGDLEM